MAGQRKYVMYVRHGDGKLHKMVRLTAAANDLTVSELVEAAMKHFFSESKSVKQGVLDRAKKRLES